MHSLIIAAYGLNVNDYNIVPFGSGLINDTWKLEGKPDSYILQRINTDVFKAPEAIAANLQLLDAYFKQHFPSYIFPAPINTLAGQVVMVIDGNSYRLLPFVAKSYSVDYVQSRHQAFEAARQFGCFTKLLQGFNVLQLQDTMPNFHNLNLRLNQYQTALSTALTSRLELGKNLIKKADHYVEIADVYNQLINEKKLLLRVIHHDAKINNVLFDDKGNGLCLVDLDTIMPGYFISDVGDIMRTYLAQANEEEPDLDKITIREDMFEAICRGYLSEMGEVLTPTEKAYFIYSGKMMIYMQAIRFLTDFLNGDVYYHTIYPGQNLVRASNQFQLLNQYVTAELRLKAIYNSVLLNA